jgi:hypothetical protein
MKKMACGGVCFALYIAGWNQDQFPKHALQNTLMEEDQELTYAKDNLDYCR